MYTTDKRNQFENVMKQIKGKQKQSVRTRDLFWVCRTKAIKKKIAQLENKGMLFLLVELFGP